MNEVNKPRNNDEITDSERYEYYQSLVLDLNSKISVNIIYIYIYILYFKFLN